MPTPTLHFVFAVLLAAAAPLPRRRAALAGAGLAGYALGAGAFAAVPGVVAVGPLASRLAAVGLSPTFVGINVGLMLLGGAVVTGAGLAAATGAGPTAQRLAGGVAAAGGIAALGMLIPLLRVAGVPAAGAAAGFALVAVLAVALGRLVARLATRAGGPRGEQSAADVAAVAPPRRSAAVAAAAGLVALAAPHALLIIAAALVAAIAAHIAARGAGSVPRMPVLPLAAAMLVPVAWMLATIAGPVGLATAALSLVPLSVPAQALLVPALTGGAWGFLGLAPLHRWVPGPILAAIGGALLLRIGVPALGAGVQHLQPALFALGAVAAWHAALTRRFAALLAALGFVATAAIFSEGHVSPDAWVAAAVLFATATASAALAAVLARYPLAPRRAGAEFAGTRVLAVAAGIATYATIGAGLRAEVVLTVVVVAAVAAASWRAAPSQ